MCTQLYIVNKLLLVIIMFQTYRYVYVCVHACMCVFVCVRACIISKFAVSYFLQKRGSDHVLHII